MTASAEDYRPLSVRHGAPADSYDVLHEGVPAHLRPSLSDWIRDRLQYDFRVVRRLERALRLTLGASDTPAALYIMESKANENPTLLLDVADFLLYVQHQRFRSALELWDRGGRFGSEDDVTKHVLIAKDLQLALFEGGSAWTVDLADDRWQLVRRVDETVRNAAEEVMRGSSSAGASLREAWSAAFRRDPDYKKAFGHAVEAVEAAATPVLTPRDPKPSLGKAIAHLRDTLARWTVADLDDQSVSAATLHAMLQTLWGNQGRHVSDGGLPPEPVTREEAEAAVFLAVTLVQWFASGAVRPRTTQ